MEENANVIHPRNLDGQSEQLNSRLNLENLLNATWTHLKSSLWSLLGIYLITSVVGILIGIILALIGILALLLTILIEIPVVTALVGIVFVAALIVLFLWMTLWQMVASIKYLSSNSEMSVLEAVKTSKQTTKQLLPTYLVYSLVTLGAFSLFVIPGIVLFISLSFVVYVAVMENLTMWQAMSRSAEIVKGRWWQVFKVLIGAGIIFLIANLATGSSYSPLMLILFPVSMVLGYIMYTELVKDREASKDLVSANIWYKIFAVIGFLVVSAGILAGLIAAANTSWDKFTNFFQNIEDDKDFDDNMWDNKYEDMDGNSWTLPDNDMNRDGQDLNFDFPTNSQNPLDNPNFDLSPDSTGFEGNTGVQ